MYVAGLRWDTHNAAGPDDGSAGIGWHPLVRERDRLRRAASGGAVSVGTRRSGDGIGAGRRVASARRLCRLLPARKAIRRTSGALEARQGSPPNARAHEYPSAASAPRNRCGRLRFACSRRSGGSRPPISTGAPRRRPRLRALAAASVGQARSEMELTAAQVRGDRNATAGGIANRGTVEAVARLPSGRGRYVVVTRERTTATYTTAYAGLAPAWHVPPSRHRGARGLVPRAGGRGPRHWAGSVWQPPADRTEPFTIPRQRRRCTGAAACRAVSRRALPGRARPVGV